MYGYIGEIVVSYFHNVKGDETNVDPSIPLQMLGLCLLALSIFNPMGPILYKYMGIKILILLGMGTQLLAIVVGAYYVDTYF